MASERKVRIYVQSEEGHKSKWVLIPPGARTIADFTESAIAKLKLDCRPADVDLYLAGGCVLDEESVDLLTRNDEVSIRPKQTTANYRKRALEQDVPVPVDYPNKKIKTPPQNHPYNANPSIPIPSTPITHSSPSTSNDIPPKPAVVPAPFSRFRSAPAPQRPILRSKPVPSSQAVADPYGGPHVAGSTVGHPNYEEKNYLPMDPHPDPIPPHLPVTHPPSYTPVSFLYPSNSPKLPVVPRSRPAPVLRSQPPAIPADAAVKPSIPVAAPEKSPPVARPNVAAAPVKPTRSVFQPTSKDKKASIYGGTSMPARPNKPKETDRNNKLNIPMRQQPIEVSKRPSFGMAALGTASKPKGNGATFINLEGEPRQTKAPGVKGSAFVERKKKNPFISVGRKNPATAAKPAGVVRTKQPPGEKRRVSSDEKYKKSLATAGITKPSSDDRSKRPAKPIPEVDKGKKPIAGARKDPTPTRGIEKKTPPKRKNPFLTGNKEKKTSPAAKGAIPTEKTEKNTPPVVRKDRTPQESSHKKAVLLRTDTIPVVCSEKKPSRVVRKDSIPSGPRKAAVKASVERKSKDSQVEVKKRNVADKSEEEASADLNKTENEEKKVEDSKDAEDSPEGGMELNVEKGGAFTIVQYMKENRQKWATKQRCPVRLRLLVEEEGGVVGVVKPSAIQKCSLSPKILNPNELRLLMYDDNVMDVLKRMGRGARQKKAGTAAIAFGRDMVANKKVYLDARLVHSFSFDRLGDNYNDNAGEKKRLKTLVRNSDVPPPTLDKKINSNTDIRKDGKNTPPAPTKRVPKVKVKIPNRMTKHLGLHKDEEAKKKDDLRKKREEARRKAMEEEARKKVVEAPKEPTPNVKDMDTDFNGFMLKLLSSVATTVQDIGVREGILSQSAPQA